MILEVGRIATSPEGDSPWGMVEVGGLKRLTYFDPLRWLAPTVDPTVGAWVVVSPGKSGYVAVWRLG